MAKFGFDPNDYPDDGVRGGSYEPFPPGEYRLKCLEAEEIETGADRPKDERGLMIKAKFEVVKGEHEGRLMWHNFNTVVKPKDRTEKAEKNAATAQNIGRRDLANWARACGKPGAGDTDQLIDVPFDAKVGIQKGSGGYKDSNRVEEFINPDPDAQPARKTTNGSGETKATEDKAETKTTVDTRKADPKPATGGGKSKNPWDD